MIRAMGGLIAVLLAGPAAAHGTLPGGNGFLAGALHPLVALDHLLALLVAGLAMGSDKGNGGAAIGLGALFAGVVLGLAPGAVPGPVPGVILLVALVMGALLLSGRGLHIGVITPPVLLLGWAIGRDTDIPAGAAGAGAGLFVATGLIALNAAALAQWAGVRWSLLPRVAGSWVFAISLLVLAFRSGTGGGTMAALP